ncbi:MAG: hypothetical protein A3K18_33840 [Lentisphaerae bacterium RIFOXYA12_64_32]|nr:MAG: hypothetical protein A3K18_33840 [Lentisphaerae bacterium RIFOXYA12_64_32]
MNRRLLLASSIGVGVLMGGWLMRAGAGEAAASVREPAVQGQFYPADKDELARTVDEFLARKPANTVPGRIRALICPHAGYVFSGAVAAEGFQQVPKDTNRVVILAPSHHLGMRGGGSILDVQAFRNALGDVPVAPAARELLQNCPFFMSIPQAHAAEHSLEVMLPFLQRRLASFSLVPIVLGQDFDTRAMAEALAPLADDPTTLFVASTDLSHYNPYDQACSMDRQTVATILAMKPQDLTQEQLCGRMPVSVLLELAKLKAWTPTLVDYRNSGDTAGDKTRVVGYACIAFTASAPATTAAVPPETTVAATVTAPPPPEARRPDPGQTANEESQGGLLSGAERSVLLDLARRSIVAKLKGESLPKLPTYSDVLLQKLGCFVTLQKNGQLRGCIGTIYPVYPLAQAIQQNALSAAFNDTRFSPVEPAEMEHIDVEISVLTLPVEVKWQTPDDLLNQLFPRLHGVVLSQGPRRSTYLPQVWDQIPDKVQFLTQLCLKGGMPKDAWRDPTKTKIEIYEAYVFGEKTTQAQ